jgi:hypothetical protein
LDDAGSILDEVEANYRAKLYEARWNEAAAEDLLPVLIRSLQSTDRLTLLRCFRALVTIGPLARAALDACVPHLASDDPDVCDSAAHAKGCIALRDPAAAIPPLVAAFRPGREKAILHALLGFGAFAQRAAPIFAHAFNHKSSSIRRLAIRGLKAIQAPGAVVDPVLVRAESDRSQAVRECAAKLFGHRNH